MTSSIGVCKIGETEYPNAFIGLKGMPGVIYYLGDISIVNSCKKVAIVGSRKCSDTALSFSNAAGRIAAQMGIAVVNGLALGCDTEAIRGATSLDGKCIAVMPGGLDEIYPMSNGKLAERILECG